jgi:hypothetical protein
LKRSLIVFNMVINFIILDVDFYNNLKFRLLVCATK